MKQYINKVHLCLVIFVMLLWCANAVAQTDRQFIRQGNNLFHQKKFDKAEVEYRKALSKNGQNPQAIYNLATALMFQNKDSLAIVQYVNAGKLEKSKIRKAKVYHNMGFIFQRHKQYSQAIKAYEEALRNNHTDDETRYNLALCKRLAKNEKDKNNNGGGKDNKKDNKKDKQDKDKQQQQNNKQQQQKQQPQTDKMSKENAEQLLNAAVQSEKATQQRIQKAMQKQGKRQLEKGW